MAKTGDRSKLIEEICNRYKLVALYVFGSRAHQTREWLDRGRLCLTDGESDLDIGVKPLAEVHLRIQEKAQLAGELEDLFGCRRVDLVALPEVDPFLAAEIVRGERIYAADRYWADEYELYILRRAGDLAPMERERLAKILEEKDEPR